MNHENHHGAERKIYIYILKCTRFRFIKPEEGHPGFFSRQSLFGSFGQIISPHWVSVPSFAKAEEEGGKYIHAPLSLH